MAPMIISLWSPTALRGVRLFFTNALDFILPSPRNPFKAATIKKRVKDTGSRESGQPQDEVRMFDKSNPSKYNRLQPNFSDDSIQQPNEGFPKPFSFLADIIAAASCGHHVSYGYI